MAKSITNKNENFVKIKLSNNPTVIDLDIREIHTKVRHLRRTNDEIRKNYMNDKDCKIAF